MYHSYVPYYVNIGKYEMIAQTSYATITYQLNQK